MPLDIQNIHILDVNKQSQYPIFLVINAFAINKKKISFTLNTTNGLYILETYNVMQIFVAICKKTLEFNIKCTEGKYLMKVGALGCFKWLHWFYLRFQICNPIIKN